VALQQEGIHYGTGQPRPFFGNSQKFLFGLI
jgi:hypothetical protein